MWIEMLNAAAKKSNVKDMGTVNYVLNIIAIKSFHLIVKMKNEGQNSLRFSLKEIQ
jgi:hypothetical protein